MDRLDIDDAENQWPLTRVDVRRLQGYENWLKLYLGQHKDVFDPYRQTDAGPYVAVNVAGAISRLVAHRLFGDPAKPRVKGRYGEPALDITGGDEKPTKQQKRALKDLSRQQDLLDLLTHSNGWQQLCYQGALGGSYRGDTVYKVRYDSVADSVVIEEVPPSIYFPTIADEQQDRVDAVSLAWVIGASAENQLPEPNGETTAWLREEHHTPGRIENRLWKLSAVAGEDRWIRRPVELTALEQTAELAEVVETGLSVIPIVHIANRRTAEMGIWGQSDYGDLASLQEALNRRRTQTGHILDKHADPLLAVDESFLDENGRLPMDRIRAIPIVQDEHPPEYVTWDGKLSDSHRESEELVKLILLVAGVSPESLGFGGGGSDNDSGLAIRLRQMLTTSTVAGKRLRWEPGLQQLLSIASMMFVEHVVGKDRHELAGVDALQPEQIGLEFGDGLPRDLSSVIRDEATLQASGLASTEASLRRLFPDWSEADVAAEKGRLVGGG